MSRPDDLVDGTDAALNTIAESLDGAALTVATAESLTAGQIATHLGAASGSGQWLAGGVVAYSAEVKYTVLGVDRGPVVTAKAAAQMAAGAARLLGADVTVAVTGVGGPSSQDGREPGTVFIALDARGATEVVEHHFAGDPGEVLAATTRTALDMVARAVTRLVQETVS